MSKSIRTNNVRSPNNILMVAYDFVGGTSSTYRPILSFVKSHNYRQISESCYLISTSASVESVARVLRPYLPNDTNFSVAKLEVIASFNPTEASGWTVRYLI